VSESSFIPTFTLVERDRRWGLVRRRMAEEKLDCLIAFPNQGRFEQLQANTRYLTQIGGFATEVALVFPIDRDPAAFVQTPRDIAFWSGAQNWIPDLRGSRRLWADAVIGRLKELSIKSVGVIGLQGLRRAPEGVVPWLMFEKVKAAFPHVDFVNATEMILTARAVKSAEEIGFIQKAEEIGEKMCETLFATARGGVPENKIYAAMVETLLAEGGELPTMIYWSCGPKLGRAHLVPTRRPLQRGDILSNEIEAKYGGYIAQVAAPAIVGPVPDGHRKLFEAAADAFAKLCPLIRPGARISDVGRAYLEILADAGYGPATWPFHGRGLGDDLPVLPDARAESDTVFEEGNVIILKPGLAPDGDEDGAERAGDTVVVTKEGAKRLGRRPFQIIEIPAA
jgi:Xaa-Pro dipeptidase